ncbi:hypothetical protein QCA50_006393 [Cerrena zonata]|uniref:FIST domain-containing protein n=1 Tax=Cerrena zonata TaxID=2478898 RepID=A0AAW0GJ16_9APHY
MALAARTLVSRSGGTLLEHLTAWSQTRDPSNTLLFSISPSPSLSPSHLSDMVKIFTSHPNTVGCLSSPLNLERTKSIPTLKAELIEMLEREGKMAEALIGRRRYRIRENDVVRLKKLQGKALFRGDGEGVTVCSWAEFDGDRAKVFRSTIPGRPVTQVGRWHMARKVGMTEEEESVGEGFMGELPPSTFDGETWPRMRELPPLPEEIKDIDPENVNTILYLSDTSPEGISQSLTRFRKATTLGLMTSSTPFVTGRPFTLFYNNVIHSSGAVGICLDAHAPARHKLVFPALKAITNHIFVTSSEGNLVHTLNDENPTEILIAAIKKHRMLSARDINLAFRDWNFYLGITPRQAPEQVFRINSADPGRGTLALEGDISPPIGSRVQILSLPTDYLSQPTPVLNRPNGQVVLNFHTTLSETPPDINITAPISIADTHVLHQDEDFVDLRGTFTASSEHGCIVSRLIAETDGEHKEVPWKASLPLGNMALAFDLKPTPIPESTAKSRRKERRRLRRRRHMPKRTPGTLYIDGEDS